VVSVTERDEVARAGCRPGAAVLDPFAAALLAAGLEPTHRRRVTAADVATLGSTWAKRLAIPARRPAWSLTARRPARTAGASVALPTRPTLPVKLSAAE
jgi:hypothetical protein